MKNVLLNVYEFDAPWAYGVLKDILTADMKVCILTMTHGNEIPDAETWEKWYTPGGHVYGILTGAYGTYGISEEQISFVGMYHDTPETARKKMEKADVLFMTGGLPDLFYERMKAMELIPVVQNFSGVVMGCSAGAMVQMKEYHITPDEDYDTYGYYPGLGLLEGFEPEVHYAATAVQQESITRYLSERGKTVYAMTNAGALLVEGDKLTPFGDVTVYVEASK